MQASKQATWPMVIFLFIADMRVRKINPFAGWDELFLPGTVITTEEVISSKKIVMAENEIGGYYIL